MVGVTGAVTVTCTVTAGALVPPKPMAVGPSAVDAVSVTVQLACGAKVMGQVEEATVMPLVGGMAACTLNAGAVPLLVMVTEPAPFAPNDTGVAGMDSVVGATIAVAVTGMVVAGVLLPPKAMGIGPSAVGAVSVIVQLASGTSEAVQVLADTVMPLPAGIVACTLSAGAEPLLVMVTEPAPPAPNEMGVTGMVSVVGGTAAVTLTCIFAAGVLLPPMPMVVGPSAAADPRVSVQLAPAAREGVQVLPVTVMPLPPGMVAFTFNAGAVPLLVTVTDPVLPAANDSGVAGMLSVVAGAGPPVTVTGVVVAAALLPAMLTEVGPSAAGAVRVMAQLEPAGSVAAQLLEEMLMPLPAGMVACTLSAADAPLLLTFTVPVLPAAKERPGPGTLSVVGLAPAVASAASVRQIVSTFTRHMALGAMVFPTAQGGGGDAGGAPGGTRWVNPDGKH